MTDENTTMMGGQAATTQSGQQVTDPAATADSFVMPPFQFDDIVLNQETKPMASDLVSPVSVPMTLDSIDNEQVVAPVPPQMPVMPEIASLDSLPSMPDDLDVAPVVTQVVTEPVATQPVVEEFVLPTLDMSTIELPSIDMPETIQEPVVSEPTMSESTFSEPTVPMPEQTFNDVVTMPVEESVPQEAEATQQQRTSDDSYTTEELLPQTMTPEATEEVSEATEEPQQFMQAETQVQEQTEAIYEGSLTEQFFGVQKLVKDLLALSLLQEDQTVEVTGMQSDAMTVTYNFSLINAANTGLLVVKHTSLVDQDSSSTTLKLSYNEGMRVLEIYLNDKLALEEKNYLTDDDDGKHYVSDKLNKFSALLDGNIARIKKQQKQAQQERAERKKLLNQLRDF